MKRRHLLGIVGEVGAGGVAFGYAGSERIRQVLSAASRDALEHEISIRNRRGTANEVRVLANFGTNTSKFGPHRLEADDSWDVIE